MGNDMVKTNLKEKKAASKAKLKVVDDSAIKTTAYSDINLKQWRNYEHIKTDTLWEFPSRLKEGGHSNEYHGNYIPQIAQQIYERFTKENDIVLDLFFGSGTSGIEAINMKRRCIGVELKDEEEKLKDWDIFKRHNIQLPKPKEIIHLKEYNPIILTRFSYPRIAGWEAEGILPEVNRRNFIGYYPGGG